MFLPFCGKSFEIPALYILDMLFPLYGLTYAQFTAELILAAVAVLALARIFKKMPGGVSVEGKGDSV